MRTLPTLLLLLMLSANAGAQRGGSDFNPRRLRRNVISLNFPTYVSCGQFPGGISIGAEYRRLFLKKGWMSANAGYTRLIWAGTHETGEIYDQGERANVHGNFFVAGLNAHPFGAGRKMVAGLGAQLMMGGVRRSNTYAVPGTYVPLGNYIATSTVLIPQIRAGLAYHARSGFYLAADAAIGRMLVSDLEVLRSNTKHPAETVKGNYYSVGLRIGGYF